MRRDDNSNQRRLMQTMEEVLTTWCDNNQGGKAWEGGRDALRPRPPDLRYDERRERIGWWRGRYDYQSESRRKRASLLTEQAVENIYVKLYSKLRGCNLRMGLLGVLLWTLCIETQWTGGGKDALQRLSACMCIPTRKTSTEGTCRRLDSSPVRTRTTQATPSATTNTALPVH